jgi:hypothetical protein
VPLSTIILSNFRNVPKVWYFLLPGFVQNSFYISKRSNKMKNKKYHTFGTFLKFDRIIVERGTLDSSDTQIHNSLWWHRTMTGIQNVHCIVKQ